VRSSGRNCNEGRLFHSFHQSPVLPAPLKSD
jgi:hypothetical protein